MSVQTLYNKVMKTIIYLIMTLSFFAWFKYDDTIPATPANVNKLSFEFIPKNKYSSGPLTPNLTDIDSLPTETLPEPITLEDCPGVQIVEWRPTNHFESTTGPSIKAISVLNKTCKKAVKGFYEFLSVKHLSKQNYFAQFTQKICLMPARIDRGGNEIRNLNDSSFRFQKRKINYTSDGIKYIVSGWTQYDNETIFIMNDVLKDDGSINDKFITVFSHELFHAMAFRYNIVTDLSGKKNDEQSQIDINENMAISFTEYLGLGR